MSSAQDDASKKVPTWLLERAAQGELAPSQVDELKTRLASEGRSLETELAALGAANQQVHSRIDKDRMVAEIRRRAARSTETPSRLRSFNLFIAPLALAGSLGIGLLLLRSGHGGGPSHQGGPITEAQRGGSESAEYVGFKGTQPSVSRLWVYRQRTVANQEQPERLSNGARAARGDLLQLAYAAGPDGHFGVLLSIDGAGRVTQHLPEPGASAAATLRSPSEIRLPSAYELDDAPGFERFLLITSVQPFPVAAVLDAARSLAAQGQSARTAQLPLPPAFHQTSVLLQKTSKGSP